MNKNLTAIGLLGLYIMQTACSDDRHERSRNSIARRQERFNEQIERAFLEDPRLNVVLETTEQSGRDAITITTYLNPLLFRRPTYAQAAQTGLSLINPDTALRTSHAIGHLNQDSSSITSNLISSIGSNHDDYPSLEESLTSDSSGSQNHIPLNQRRRGAVTQSMVEDSMPTTIISQRLIDMMRSSHHASQSDDDEPSLFAHFPCEDEQPER